MGQTLSLTLPLHILQYKFMHLTNGERHKKTNFLTFSSVKHGM